MCVFFRVFFSFKLAEGGSIVNTKFLSKGTYTIEKITRERIHLKCSMKARGSSSKKNFVGISCKFDMELLRNENRGKKPKIGNWIKLTENGVSDNFISGFAPFNCEMWMKETNKTLDDVFL